MKSHFLFNIRGGTKILYRAKRVGSKFVITWYDLPELTVRKCKYEDHEVEAFLESGQWNITEVCMNNY